MASRTFPPAPDLDRGRRAALTCLLAAGLGGASRAFATADPPRIVVLPLDFQDDHENPATIEAQVRRLKSAHAQLQQELQAQGLYRVVDLAPAQSLVDESLASQAFLYRCPDCVMRIGRKVDAPLVMTSWVQKVSELILNFNVEVFRVADEHSVLSKSVDMRGNQDESWQRAVRYLVRDMAEKRAANPAYGT